MLKIKLNGEEKHVPKGTTVQNLLDEMNIKGTMFVTEKNLQILPKEQYAFCEVSQDDNIEVVGFFGGG